MKIQPVILFDGVCNFCNSSVNFVIHRDKNAVIRFTPIQSLAGQQLMEQFNIPKGWLDTFIFIENGKPYFRSTAAIRVCKYLGFIWPVCFVFLGIPAFIRDKIYNYIAANRYTWFGKKDACMIPTPDVKGRFLS